MTAGQLVDAALTRTRDPEGTGTSRQLVRLLLDRTQQHVNAVRPNWITSTTVTIPAQQALIHLNDLTPDPVTLVVTRVTHEGRDLVESTWDRLVRIDPLWMRARGSRPRRFAQIGTDLLAITPASDLATTVTLYYAGVPPTLASDDDVSPLADDWQIALKELAECLLLIRQQDLESLPAAGMTYKATIELLATARGA